MERKEIIVIVLIGVLLLTTALQTVQLVGLSQTKVIAATVSGAAPMAGAGAPAVTSSVPTSLRDLPSMVGGC